MNINRLYITAIVSLLFITTGCERFLDLKPTNALLADNAVYDAKTSRALVNAGYSRLKSYYTGSALNLAILPGDNVFFGGSQSQNIELDNHAFTVTNSAIVSAYAANYSLINVANWAISEIPKVQDDAFATGEQNKLIGEAYFIRAFGYFNLVRSWGGVQLQLNPTTDLSSLGNIARSSEADTYKQILQDLDRSFELLPDDNSSTRNVLQKSILRAVRAKVLLYAKQYDLIETEATSVINNSKYTLVKPYNLFFAAPFSSAESVFEFSSTTNNAGTSGSMWFPASGTPRGSYEYRPTNEIINLLNDGAKGGSRKTLLATRGADIYANLYHTVSPNINPAYVLRIADVYLIRAEARVRRSNPDLLGAVDDLNKVRSRADAALYSASNINATDLLKAIWDERRLEFAFESDRWYDLVRTEQAQEVLGVQRNFWFFPIPQADILPDPALGNINNTGY